MTAKVIKIIIGDQQILIDKKDLRGVDLSKLIISSNGYVVVNNRKYLHRLIMQPPANMDVDHKNKNKLDNRRCNLRICTKSENQWNRGKQRNNSTGYKGVDGDKRKKFRARIAANKKDYYLGIFERPDEAGAAYAKAAKQYHGKFARITEG